MPTLDGRGEVTLEDLTKSYRGFTLGPVNSTLKRGVSALLGANGAGKTTLMRLVVGTLRPSSGHVRLPQSSEMVGFLPQDFTAPRQATVQDYLTFVGWCRSRPSAKISAGHISDALHSVGLHDRRGAQIGSLSGGMVRRLGFAQALLGEAAVIVLDEPTVGLDPIQRSELREVIARLGEQRTVLISTHLAEDVASISDTILILDGGKLLYDGSVAMLCVGREVSSEAVESGFLDVVREGQSEMLDA